MEVIQNLSDFVEDVRFDLLARAPRTPISDLARQREYFLADYSVIAADHLGDGRNRDEITAGHLILERGGLALLFRQCGALAGEV